MLKILGLALLALLVIALIGTGVGSGSSPGMFIKIIGVLMLFAVISTVSVLLIKRLRT